MATSGAAPVCKAMHIRYRWVHVDRDRHGNARVYFWRRPGAKIRIRETPGSEAFARRYHELVAGDAPEQAPAVGSLRPAPEGTFGWLVAAYVGSAAFRGLGASTQTVRRQILEHCCREPVAPGETALFAHFPLDRLSRRALAVLRDRKADLPGAATGRVKALRPMFRWAVAEDILAADPARDLGRARAAGKAAVPWTPADVAAFEARHPVGSKARLALAILLYTGMRRSDVVQFGRQHVKDGWISKPQWKGRARHPQRLEMPLLPALAEIIDASPTGDLTYLVTDYGRPFAIAGFGNWFRARCNEAGLPHLSAHGMRKAGAALLADRGATAHQLMAIFGWRSLAEAELYTRAADRKRLAREGLALLDVPTMPDSGDGDGEKRRQINARGKAWRALRGCWE